MQRNPVSFEDLLRGRVPAAPLEREDLFARGRRATNTHTSGSPRKVGRPMLQRSGGAAAMTADEVVAERRAALQLVKLEPGLGYWLAKQRWLWRQNRLPQERLQMLLLAGVEMDTCTSPREWLVHAHAAARIVTGGCPVDSPAPPWPAIPLPPLPPQPQASSPGPAASRNNGSSTGGYPASPGLPDLYGYTNPRAAHIRSPSPTRPGVFPAAAGPPPGGQMATDLIAAAAKVFAQPADAPKAKAAAEKGGGGVQKQQRRGRSKGSPDSGPPAPTRQVSPVAVRRWVLTQKLLVEQRSPGLSAPQFFYLQLLGITWLLSDQVIAMRPAVWMAQYERLASTSLAPGARPDARPCAALREWLSHQKGLRHLGMLAPYQVVQLERLNVRWRQPLTESESRWAACFAHLVAFARRHGHCQVPRDIGPLAQWLAHQLMLWGSGQLPATRQAQLRALGVVVPPAASVQNVRRRPPQF